MKMSEKAARRLASMLHTNTQHNIAGLPSDVPGPTLPPTRNRGSSRGLRTGAIILLAALLAVVLGTGLFAGWVFSGGSNTAILQPGPTTIATLLPSSGENIETVREAVIAKVRPAIVQINVATAKGQGLGSGVIVDQRGYI